MPTRNRKVGWYVWIKDAKGTPKLVSGTFETKGGADVYRRLYEANYPGTEPYIEQHAIIEEAAK